MDGILEKINSPEDLKLLTESQLRDLAAEMRRLIVATVSENGGHLAPNLGTVELTIALHRVFSCPQDKIVWDVGHQAYGHKILTGRHSRFSTLRQLGGITGFPNRSESIYDSFGVGHSSTSISAALGMATARDLNYKRNEVIAVIGDGSMTGGEAYEAMNHAGDVGRHMIVVLNDNEMSIDKNVGALSEYFTKMRTAPSYNKVKHDLDLMLRSIPTIGTRVAKTIDRIKDGLKFFVLEGGIFEAFGFTYIGPIDGHDITVMSDVFKKARQIEGPVLIHVVTKKGKGYAPAESEPDKFHGVGRFNSLTGEIIKQPDAPPTYTAVFSKTLIKLASDDADIVAVTAAMPTGTGLKQFGDVYPSRFFDVGIAEQHAVTFASGMASEGKKPVVALYSTFAQRAYDQIIHDVCLQKLPVVFALDRAGLVGDDGPTHHGVFDFSYLRHMPNMTVMAPKDENELQHMLYTAFRLNAPAAVRYPRGSGLGVPLDETPHMLEVGRAEELIEGDEAVIFAVGTMVEPCRRAAEILKEAGHSVGVVNARFIKPLDTEALQRAAEKVKYIVTAEENTLSGGFGSAVLEFLSDSGFSVRTLRLGLPDDFVEQGNKNLLMDIYGLTAEKIADRISSFITGSSGCHLTRNEV